MMWKMSVVMSSPRSDGEDTVTQEQPHEFQGQSRISNFILYCLSEGAPCLLPLSAQASGHLKEVEKA